MAAMSETDEPTTAGRGVMPPSPAGRPVDATSAGVARVADARLVAGCARCPGVAWRASAGRADPRPEPAEGCTVLRQVLLQASKSDGDPLTSSRPRPVSRQVVRRYVPGTDPRTPSGPAADLLGQGLDDDPRPPRRGHHRPRAGRRRPRRLPRPARPAVGRRAHPGRPGRGVGEAVGRRPGAAARRREDRPATTPARSARPRPAAGTTVTLDMEDHTTTDSTLAVLRELREDFPWIGAVLQAYLRRTEADCRDLADGGLAGAAVQGRVRRAGLGRVPGSGRRRPVLRALPEGADGRRRATRWSPPTTRG